MTQSEDRCELTDLLRSDCAHCRPARETFIALWPGECVTCNLAIRVGQKIRELPSGRYEHGIHQR